MNRLLLWLPLVFFAGLFLVVGTGLLKPAERSVKSAMVGKTIPQISLPPMLPTKPGLDAGAFRTGQPRLLNVFASWCIPCIAEAPILLQLKQAGVRIDAVAIRDTPENIAAFLARNGDPYERIGDDRESSVQLALGSSGVPETFIVDGKGQIIAQHIGDIRADDVPGILRQVQAAR